MNDNTTLEQRLTGWDAGDLRPPTFPSADVSYVVDDTAVGRILFARNDSGALVATRYVTDDVAVDAVLDRLARSVSPRVLRMPAALDDARHQLDDFLAGRRHDFDLESTWRSRRRSSAVSSRPWPARSGTASARRTAGWPGPSTGRRRRGRSARRSARTRCASCVPCHRVVGSHGALTGYAGGVAAKEYLLDLETAG